MLISASMSLHTFYNQNGAHSPMIILFSTTVCSHQSIEWLQSSHTERPSRVAWWVELVKVVT